MGTAECPKGGWTVETAVKYLVDKIDSAAALADEREARNSDKFQASKDAVAFALTAAEKAVIKAETASEKRFESVNEFRNTLRDQQATLMPRSEYTVQHQALMDRVTALENITRDSIGRTAGVGSVGNIVLGIFVVITSLSALASVLLVLLRH